MGGSVASSGGAGLLDDGEDAAVAGEDASESAELLSANDPECGDLPLEGAYGAITIRACAEHEREREREQSGSAAGGALAARSDELPIPYAIGQEPTAALLILGAAGALEEHPRIAARTELPNEPAAAADQREQQDSSGEDGHGGTGFQGRQASSSSMDKSGAKAALGTKRSRTDDVHSSWEAGSAARDQNGIAGEADAKRRRVELGERGGGTGAAGSDASPGSESAARTSARQVRVSMVRSDEGGPHGWRGVGVRGYVPGDQAALHGGTDAEGGSWGAGGGLHRDARGPVLGLTPEEQRAPLPVCPVEEEVDVLGLMDPRDAIEEMRLREGSAGSVGVGTTAAAVHGEVGSGEDRDLSDAAGLREWRRQAAYETHMALVA